MAPNSSKWLQTAPIGSKWLQMAPNGSKWLEMARNGSKWLQMAPNGSKWLPIAPNGSKRLQMAPNGSKWLQMTPNGIREGRLLAVCGIFFLLFPVSSSFIPFSPFIPVYSLNFTPGVRHWLPWPCFTIWPILHSFRFKFQWLCVQSSRQESPT